MKCDTLKEAFDLIKAVGLYVRLINDEIYGGSHHRMVGNIRFVENGFVISDLKNGKFRFSNETMEEEMELSKAVEYIVENVKPQDNVTDREPNTGQGE